jgi:hypothetical protein
MHRFVGYVGGAKYRKRGCNSFKKIEDTLDTLFLTGTQYSRVF